MYSLCNACGLRWAKQKNPDEARPLKKIAPKKATPTPKKMSHLLFHRKEFIGHGLYSVENRQGTNKPTRFELPLPIHQGESTLLTIKEFELPPFIWQERELNLIKSLKDKRPVFTKIRSNLFVERKPKLCPDERNVCHCKEPTGENEVGCGDDCINRYSLYISKICPSYFFAVGYYFMNAIPNIVLVDPNAPTIDFKKSKENTNSKYSKQINVAGVFVHWKI